MIPYIEHPTLDLGFHQIQAFPVLVGIAIIVQFQIVLRRAPVFGIDRRTASTLVGWAIFLGLFGAHVFDVIAYSPEKLLENPLILFALWGGLSSMGGMLSGLTGLWVVMWRKGMSGAEMLRFVDCLIFALPFTLAIGRAGCALQHDHPGLTSTHWLAVDFPLGARFDLGLLEFLYMSIVSAAFAGLGRRRRPDGFYVGLFFALYGPVRFAMDALRIADARYFGWTPGQYLSILSTLFGVGVLASVLRAGRQQAPAG
jgi:phosphatidylglycerol:prolipoprotein diacylglycerol transferase